MHKTFNSPLSVVSKTIFESDLTAWTGLHTILISSVFCAPQLIYYAQCSLGLFWLGTNVEHGGGTWWGLSSRILEMLRSLSPHSRVINTYCMRWNHTGIWMEYGMSMNPITNNIHSWWEYMPTTFARNFHVHTMFLNIIILP